jgi:hypothetical protein
LESGGGFGPYLEWLEQLTAAGVSQLIVEIPADSAQHGIEALEQYGQEVITAAGRTAGTELPSYG